MKVWMDVMRQIEPLLDDYPAVFDAWQEGGVEGMVIGPLCFAGGQLAYDPDPAVYRRAGCPVPASPSPPWLAKRRRLEQMFDDARRRGMSVWIFEPGSHGGTGASNHWTDAAACSAYAAGMADTMAHFPMADGCVLDGPEWGYEICPHHMGYRSYLFNDLPPAVAPTCRDLGFDYDELVVAKDELFACLHDLPKEVRRWPNDGTTFGCDDLFGHITGLKRWLEFRARSLEAVVAGRRAALATHQVPAFLIGVGMRTPALAGLTGVDLPRFAPLADVILPKHYFWHRGFDGLYGTLFRYVEVLTQWNPGMSDRAAMGIIAGVFGLELPWLNDRDDFDHGFPDEFFQMIVRNETITAIEAAIDGSRVMPWVDAGRRPHGGDPFGAPELRKTLIASQEAGLQRFLYHHHYNLTAAEWQVMSGLCGKSWRPQYHCQPVRQHVDPETLAFVSCSTNYADFDPPDRDIY